MSDPMRIRAKIEADRCVVRVLISHEMENGLRRDEAGQLVPAHFIQRVSALHEGRLVFNAFWGTSVSKNPVLQFAFAGAKAGDRIQITWLDNRGETRTDEARVQA
jgi:sulfur-oxidizing protein SoxZ